METWRKDLVNEAKTWLQTPWHHEGRVKGAGADCGQLLIACYVNTGLVPQFDTGHYPRDWMFHRSEERFLGWVTQYLDEVGQPLPGDVVAWKHARCFSHGAIVVEWPVVIHAHVRSRQVCYANADQGELSHAKRGGARPKKFFSIAGRL